MTTKLIPIGNSRGIRIPKALIEQAALGEEVELQVRGNRLIIQSPRRPRAEWDTAFAAMHKRGHDKLLDMRITSFETEWECSEWKW